MTLSDRAGRHHQIMARDVDVSLPPPPSSPQVRIIWQIARPVLSALFTAGCHTTELQLSCPASAMILIEAATFSPTGARLNCSAHTRHSSPAPGPAPAPHNRNLVDLRQERILTSGVMIDTDPKK